MFACVCVCVCVRVFVCAFEKQIARAPLTPNVWPQCCVLTLTVYLAIPPAVTFLKALSDTVFGKHCECIAQKCTHLGRHPPLTSHSLLVT